MTDDLDKVNYIDDRKSMSNPSVFKVRWMIRRDMSDVLAIETLSNKPALDERGMLTILRCRNCIAMVIEDRDLNICGYMIYKLNPTFIKIISLATHPDFRMMGVGSSLIDRLKTKLSSDRRTKIVIDVPDHQYRTHEFLLGCGFLAISIRNSDDCDYYLFEHQLIND